MCQIISKLPLSMAFDGWGFLLLLLLFRWKGSNIEREKGRESNIGNVYIKKTGQTSQLVVVETDTGWHNKQTNKQIANSKKATVESSTSEEQKKKFFLMKKKSHITDIWWWWWWSQQLDVSKQEKKNLCHFRYNTQWCSSLHIVLDSGHPKKKKNLVITETKL